VEIAALSTGELRFRYHQETTLSRGGSVGGVRPTRLVPGFVVDTRMDGDARIVTFGNGMVAREEIVSVDEPTRRVAWAIVGQQFRHYNAAAQVFDNDHGGTRFLWTTDLLPNELASNVSTMMEAGIAVIKKTMEKG
jgi:hypothetical protein